MHEVEKEVIIDKSLKYIHIKGYLIDQFIKKRKHGIEIFYFVFLVLKEWLFIIYELLVKSIRHINIQLYSNIMFRYLEIIL